MGLRIEDYAIVGDCHTVALVGKDGSIDWLCLPRFDSGACFAALLGTRENGRWQLAPADRILETQRQYQGNTLVLETEFTTPSGKAALIDFMPIRESVPNVVRMVEGRSGRVAMHMDLTFRFDYGSIVPWVRREEGGIQAIAGPDAVHLRSPIATHGKGMSTVADFTVAAGERVAFTLTWRRSFDAMPQIPDAESALRETLRWWNDWSQRCCCAAPYQDLVRRSLITLKALIYAPSGGIVAAPTTSLPEHLGGVRNWDYRYCWLRDATLTLLTLIHSGYVDEARSWQEWLLRAVAGDPGKTQTMYGLGGERRLEEFVVPWLAGYENSGPVRVGNAAHAQFQLDVYGEVCDALYQAARAGLKPEEAEWGLQQALLRHVEIAWNRSDEGIWEVRGPRQQFVHSKVMAWVALDRGIKSAERCGLDAPLPAWRRSRQQIHDKVCSEGFDSRRNTFVQAFGSSALDASLLMIPAVGFLPPDDPRVRGTVDAIENNLLQDGFVLRYDTSKTDDGLPAGEGSFLPCTFWLADAHALMGNVERAHELFECVAKCRNDVGLLAEEYDPQDHRLIGNFPQAFSHLALVNTALNLAHARGPSRQRRES